MDFKKKNAGQDPYYAEEPDWMEYTERRREEALNRNRGAFSIKDKTSINTAPSVFEKGVLFHRDEVGKKDQRQ